MAKQITEKSTKTEIMEAYNEVLARLKEKQKPDRQEEKKAKEEKEIIAEVSENSIEKIVTNIANLKLEIVKSIDGLEEKLVAQQKKFAEVQQAVEIETRNLEEIYQIKVNADSLAALLLAHKEKKEEFEKEMEVEKEEFEMEMTQKQLKWKKEQEDYERAKKERDEQAKKEKQREDEEYNYNLQLQRKKDKDAYESNKNALEKELEEKKAAVEKDLAERQAIIESKEKELVELRQKVGAFPSELEKAIKDTEKSVMEKIEINYKHQTELAAKEIEGERKLYQQMIAALETKLKEKEEQIRQLTQKVNESGNQVQSIALKAIESSSGQRGFSGGGFERTPEQQQK